MGEGKSAEIYQHKCEGRHGHLKNSGIVIYIRFLRKKNKVFKFYVCYLLIFVPLKKKTLGLSGVITVQNQQALNYFGSQKIFGCNFFPPMFLDLTVPKMVRVRACSEDIIDLTYPVITPDFGIKMAQL